MSSSPEAHGYAGQLMKPMWQRGSVRNNSVYIHKNLSHSAVTKLSKRSSVPFLLP